MAFMKQDNNRLFHSKILLFGEYSLMKGSMALCIPFDKYQGQLMFDDAYRNSKSNHYSVNYLVEYYNFLEKSGFKDQLILNKFKKDIDKGLIFETNIPISYGLGSSGAIVASIFNAYAIDPSESLDELKLVFSEMESYYHGKSSGLDPLVSYLNKAIIINESGELNTVNLPKENVNSNSGVFLFDTKTVGETQPLVNWFLEEYENDDFKNKIHLTLIPANNACIKSHLTGNLISLLEGVKTISAFTFENLRPMIPASVKEIWQKGLETDKYYLKLCGSGGGGMMLGFTRDFELVKHELNNYEITKVHSI